MTPGRTTGGGVPTATAGSLRAESGRPRVDPLLFVVWTGIALAAVDLIFFSGASNFLPSPQARVVTQVIVVGSVLAWLVASIRRQRGISLIRTELLVPGLIYAGCVVLSALVSSRPESSREAVALLLISLPGYPVIQSVLRHPFLRKRLDWLLVLLTVLFLAAYLVQVADHWINWWRLLGPTVPPLRPADVGLAVGTANAVGVYAELLVAPAAWIAWRRWRSIPVTGTIVVMGVGTLLITASRGAWLGAFVGMAMVATLRLWSQRRRMAGGPARARALFRGARSRRAMVAVGAVALLGGVVLLAILPTVISRLFAGVAGRTELWQAGLQIAADHILLGGGPGSWPGLRPETLITQSNYAVLYTPHSSVIQVLAETGIAGLAAAAILVGAVSRLAWRSIHSAADSAERIERELVVASLLAMAVHSLVDPMFHIPAIVVLIFLLVARLEVGEASSVRATRLDTMDRAAPHAGRAGPSLQGAGVAIVLLAGVALLIPIDAAMVRAQRGADLLNTGRPADAMTELDAAIAVHDLAPYRVSQAIALSAIGDRNGAIAALQAARRSQPFTFIDAQIARLQAAEGLPAAVEAARRVAAAGTYDSTATLNAAIVLAGAGAHSEARGMLAAVLGEIPSLIHSRPPDGLFDPGLWAAARLDALENIRRGDRAAAALLAVRAHLEDLAAADLDRLPPGPERELVELVRRAEAGDPPDLDAARIALKQAPGNANVLAAFDRLARVARSEEDLRLVQSLSIATRFDVPPPDREIVTDGGPADPLVLALPRWPNASDSRLGPLRPYVVGFATIEPVGR